MIILIMITIQVLGQDPDARGAPGAIIYDINTYYK